jgi:predicted transcriptional regulator
MSATVPVTVRIPVDVNRRLEKLSTATARSKSWLAAEAIGIFVESEGQFLAAVEEGRKDVKRGRTIPHKDVKRWLDSWGSERELKPPRLK